MVKKPGFTLIEMLVVIAILALTTSALLYFLVSTVKSSNQATVIAELQQNGQVILNTLAEQIKGATSVSYSTSCEPNYGFEGCISLQMPGSNTVYIEYIKPVPGVSNGYIATCSDSTCTTNSPNFVTLTNKDPVAGVNVFSYGAFNISGSPGLPQAVTIGFTLYQGVQASGRQDFQAMIPFQTTVSLRSY